MKELINNGLLTYLLIAMPFTIYDAYRAAKFEVKKNKNKNVYVLTVLYSTILIFVIFILFIIGNMIIKRFM